MADGGLDLLHERIASNRALLVTAHGRVGPRGARRRHVPGQRLAAQAGRSACPAPGSGASCSGWGCTRCRAARSTGPTAEPASATSGSRSRAIRRSSSELPWPSARAWTGSHDGRRLPGARSGWSCSRAPASRSASPSRRRRSTRREPLSAVWIRSVVGAALLTAYIRPNPRAFTRSQMGPIIAYGLALAGMTMFAYLAISTSTPGRRERHPDARSAGASRPGATGRGWTCSSLRVAATGALTLSLAHGVRRPRSTPRDSRSPSQPRWPSPPTSSWARW